MAGTLDAHLKKRIKEMQSMAYKMKLALEEQMSGKQADMQREFQLAKLRMHEIMVLKEKDMKHLHSLIKQFKAQSGIT